MAAWRKVVAAAAALGSGAIPLTWNVAPAGARELFHQVKEFEVRYRDFEGRTVTCAVGGQSTLMRQDTSTPYEGQSSTFSSDLTGSGSVCNAIVSVTVTYTGAAGARRRSFALGEQQVSVVNDDVSADYLTNHQIQFLDCAFDCVVEFSTSPK